MRTIKFSGDSHSNVDLDWSGYGFPRGGYNKMYSGDAFQLDVGVKNLAGMLAANVAFIPDRDRNILFHLFVKQNFRREGLGTLCVDLFKGCLLWNDQDLVEGSIGGGRDTKKFLVKNGFPEEDVEVVERSPELQSAVIKTEKGEIDFGDVNYKIEGKLKDWPRE